MAANEAALAALKAGSTKRLSLHERIENIREYDDDTMFLFLEEMEQEHIDAIGFRHSASSTQSRQDRHLSLYLNFIKHTTRMSKEASDDQIDAVAFPEDHQLFFRYLRFYLFFIYKSAVPRSRSTGQHIEYRSLTQYRDSMLFWVDRKYEKLERSKVNQRIMYNQMTEAMRAVQKKYPKDKSAKKPESTFLGLAELRQLLDYELANALCAEYSEQHQLAWCIGRQTTVRPGSLGPSSKNEGFMKWRDITITKDDTPGQFTSVVHVVQLKTNSDDPETQLVRGKLQEKGIKLKLRSPTPENIHFSVPHRLLAIALRRNLLVGISTVEELLGTNLYNITIKEEHLDDPIFYRGTGGGSKLEKPFPLPSKGFSAFIALRAKAIGYTEGVTFYSIRRRAATDLVPIIGAAATREIMGHSVESLTLERYYYNRLAQLDITGAALAEEGSTEFPRPIPEDFAPLALGRLSDERLNKVRGEALYTLIEHMEANDPNYPHGASNQERKLYRKRIGRLASKVLLEQEAKDQKANMTVKEMQERRDALKSSTFAQTIFDRAKEMVQASPQEIEAEVEDDEFEGFSDYDQDETAINDDDTADAELEIDGLDDGTVVTSMDPELFNSHSQCEIPYEAMARSFMEIILNAASHRTKSTATELVCKLCENDPTVPLEMKEKVYRAPSKLHEHEEGRFHSTYTQWKRRMQIEHDDIDPNGRWQCPYCAEDRSFAELNNLIWHIKTYVVDSLSQESLDHDDKKFEDGWYDHDFYGTVSQSAKRGRDKKLKDLAKEEGMAWINDLCDPKRLHAKTTPHPTIPGLVYPGYDKTELTDPQPLPIPDRFKHLLKHVPRIENPKPLGTPLDYAYPEIPIPGHFKGVLKRGAPGDVDPEIPEHLKYLIKRKK